MRLLFIALILMAFSQVIASSNIEGIKAIEGEYSANNYSDTMKLKYKAGKYVTYQNGYNSKAVFECFEKKDKCGSYVKCESIDTPSSMCSYLTLKMRTEGVVELSNSCTGAEIVFFKDDVDECDKCGCTAD